MGALGHCRFCLMVYDSDSLRNLYEDIEKPGTLVSRLEEAVGLRFSNRVDVPSQVCSICADFIEISLDMLHHLRLIEESFLLDEKVEDVRRKFSLQLDTYRLNKNRIRRQHPVHHRMNHDKRRMIQQELSEKGGGVKVPDKKVIGSPLEKEEYPWRRGGGSRKGRKKKRESSKSGSSRRKLRSLAMNTKNMEILPSMPSNQASGKGAPVLNVGNQVMIPVSVRTTCSRCCQTILVSSISEYNQHTCNNTKSAFEKRSLECRINDCGKKFFGAHSLKLHQRVSHFKKSLVNQPFKSSRTGIQIKSEHPVGHHQVLDHHQQMAAGAAGQPVEASIQFGGQSSAASIQPQSSQVMSTASSLGVSPPGLQTSHILTESLASVISSTVSTSLEHIGGEYKFSGPSTSSPEFKLVAPATQTPISMDTTGTHNSVTLEYRTLSDNFETRKDISAEGPPFPQSRMSEGPVIQPMPRGSANILRKSAKNTERTPRSVVGVTPAVGGGVSSLGGGVSSLGGGVASCRNNLWTLLQNSAKDSSLRKSQITISSNEDSSHFLRAGHQDLQHRSFLEQSTSASSIEQPSVATLEQPPASIDVSLATLIELDHGHGLLDQKIRSQHGNNDQFSSSCPDKILPDSFPTRDDDNPGKSFIDKGLQLINNHLMIVRNDKQLTNAGNDRQLLSVSNKQLAVLGNKQLANQKQLMAGDKQVAALGDKQLLTVGDRQLAAVGDKQLIAVGDRQLTAIIDKQMVAVNDKQLIAALGDRQLLTPAGETPQILLANTGQSQVTELGHGEIGKPQSNLVASLNANMPQLQTSSEGFRSHDPSIIIGGGNTMTGVKLSLPSQVLAPAQEPGTVKLEKSEQKPVFTCMYENCDKIYTRKAQFEEHTRVHTGERPFKCEECGKLFARKVNLKKHKLLQSCSSVTSTSNKIRTKKNSVSISSRFTKIAMSESTS